MKKSKEEIALAYKSSPWWYDLRGFFILTFAYNSTLPAQLRFFGSNMGARHLDVACGTGTLLEMILNWRRRKGLPVVSVTGVDYAESMLAGALHRFAGQSNLVFEHADAGDLPYPDASFDTINIANAVHCLPEPDAALKECARVLKPGGTLAANVLLYPRAGWPLGPIAQRINDWGIGKGILVTPYRQEDIRARIERAGLRIREERVSGNCYEVLAERPA